MKRLFIPIMGLLLLPSMSFAASPAKTHDVCKNIKNDNLKAAVCSFKTSVDSLQLEIQNLSAGAAKQEQEQASSDDSVASLKNDIATKKAALQKNADDIKTLEARFAAIKLPTKVPTGGSGGACDNGHGNGGYPTKWCDAPQDSLVDSWGMYNREPVSYAAWKRASIGRTLPFGWGNSNQWDDRARAAGYRVDSAPEVGSVAQTDAGFYGHVGVVESVQGSTVIISEMNYDGLGHFRMGSYPATYFKYIH